MNKDFKITQMRGNNRPHVSGVRLGENKLGQILYFETDLKYVDVHFASTLDTLIVTISPDGLYREGDGKYLDFSDDEFYVHPDYFLVEIKIPTGGKHVTTLVTPLKHEYFVNIIDINDACDYEAVKL